MHMSNAEHKLSELFVADVPPSTDHDFTFAVLERVERRRAWLEVVDAVPVVVGAAFLLWVMAPVIDDLLQKTLTVLSAPAFLSAIVLTLAALTFLGLGRIREVLEL
jgi:hypothetical protein